MPQKPLPDIQSNDFYNPNLHLFVDDDNIESMHGLTRKIGVLRKEAEPVIRPDKPWEGLCLILIYYVMFDSQDKLFKMWYIGYHKKNPAFAPDQRIIPCYAVSSDGVHWEKPDLGMMPFRDEQHTNITPERVVPAIVEYDAHGDRIYRGIKFMGGEMDPITRKRIDDSYGIATATSTDGFHWEFSPGLVLPHQGDTASWMYFDYARNKYVILTRSHDTIPRSERGEKIKREIALSVSDDLNDFPQLRTVLKADEKDPPDTELYTMLPFNYGDCHIGLLEMFWHPSLCLDFQLAFSRDGENWQRDPDRTVFLQRGAPGAWDSGWVRMSRPLLVDDELWFYYCGLSTPHWEYPYRGSIGLAKLRKDGFAYLEAGTEEGSLIIEAQDLSKRKLLLNVASDTGYTKVAILDATGAEVPGFGLYDCDTINVDSVRHPVRWKGREVIEAASGGRMKIKIIMKNAKLYSFEVI